MPKNAKKELFPAHWSGSDSVFSLTFKLPLDELTEHFNPDERCQLAAKFTTLTKVSISTDNAKIMVGTIKPIENAFHRLRCTRIRLHPKDQAPFVEMKQEIIIHYMVAEGEDAGEQLAYYSRVEVTIPGYYDTPVPGKLMLWET